MELLDTIARLSREFGGPDYVKGGGGNTSAKNPETLWVKPSGSALASITPETFVALDRTRLGELYTIIPPPDAAARETMAKEKLLAAVRPGSSGRPSVESPLHDSFAAIYVVHTHPPLVNGLACGRDGEEACRDLLPDTLWIPYVDPGYTLCMRVREEIRTYAKSTGREPRVVVLKNHGLFVAGDTPDEIRARHAAVLGTLSGHYRKVGIATELTPAPMPSPETTGRMASTLRALLGEKDAAFISASGRFEIAEGPVSPDHIVYAKSFPFIGEPTADRISAFVAKHRYKPRVVACETGVFGIGPTENDAALALELAKDGALVRQLAEAFGGIEYLDDRSREFIDNWEVEAYRRKMASGGS